MIWGHARWRLSRRRPAFYALRARRLARPRHAPAPALHALAPELRGARRRGGAAGPRRPPRRRARRLLPRGRESAPTPSTSCTAARSAPRLPAGRWSRWPPPASAARSRSASPASSSSPRRLLPLVVAGGFLVLAYNLELFGGRFHTDFWFAAAWGAFPALTGWWSNALGVHDAGEAVAGVAAVLACFALSVAQRRLSHAGPRAAPPHRSRAAASSGSPTGQVRELSAATLAAPLDGAPARALARDAAARRRCPRRSSLAPNCGQK